MEGNWKSEAVSKYYRTVASIRNSLCLENFTLETEVGSSENEHAEGGINNTGLFCRLRRQPKPGAALEL